MRRPRQRRGFTLIEVALATVVLTIGILFCSTFFTNVYSQLSPRGDHGGLRRYLVGEQLLRAQAEAMRASKTINPIYVKKVDEPTGSGYHLTADLINEASNATAQYQVYDLKVVNSYQNATGGTNSNVIGTLTLSILRRKDGDDAKIGL